MRGHSIRWQSFILPLAAALALTAAAAISSARATWPDVAEGTPRVTLPNV